MEFFNKAKAVRLKSHFGKYLVVDDDGETVRQSRNGASGKARWLIEHVAGNSHVIRLKSCHIKYLAASDEPFLPGMAQKRVLQKIPESDRDSSVEWEPIRKDDGVRVTLRTRRGKFLRANGGAPPWRNSVTHDVPYRTATQDWVVWEVEIVEDLECESVRDYESIQSFCSEGFGAAEMDSPAVVGRDRYGDGAQQSAMDLFRNAKSVRLRSNHDKYLIADDDQESVCQDRNGTVKNAKWTVEIVEDSNVLRFKSRYGKYLTASDAPFVLRMTGKKVLQTMPKNLNSSVEWEPIREGVQVRLKSRYGQFLRANGGFPPWRNSITHDIPHRSSSYNWILWDVDIVEFAPKPEPKPVCREDSMSIHLVTSPKLPQEELSDSSPGSSPAKSEGRIIHYKVAYDKGDMDDAIEGLSFTFKGIGLEELTKKLEEETGLNGIIVCSRNPLNGKLSQLRLHLPPNSATMHVVLIPPSSKAAAAIEMPGSPPAT